MNIGMYGFMNVVKIGAKETIKDSGGDSGFIEFLGHIFGYILLFAFLAVFALIFIAGIQKIRKDGEIGAGIGMMLLGLGPVIIRIVFKLSSY